MESTIIDLSVSGSTGIVKGKRSFLLLLLFLIFIQYSYSQRPAIRPNEEISALTANSEIPYKNAIKGMVFPLVLYSSLSIGYERYITNQFMVEMVINNQFWFDEMGVPNYALYIMPGLKYFFVSQAKWRNNIYIGGYLLYRYKNDSHGDTTHTKFDYGIGLSLGKKMIISKDKSWFLDVGCGISSNVYGFAPLFSDSYREDKFVGWEKLIRPIVQVGKKF